MKIVKINLKNNSYNIYIKYNLFKGLFLYLKALNIGNFALIITSPNIYSKYRVSIKKAFGSIPYKIVEVAEGEQAKTEKYLFKVINELVKNDTWSRKLFIVCLGGGTIGDLGGFVASIYKRGIPYIQVPTTFLAQIDASIGGKTAIDLKEAKNILGTIYQPKAVFIDPLFLNTLGIKEIKQGVAEAIKYAAIKERSFFYFLKKNKDKIMKLEPESILKVISTCVSIKAKIVQKDEKEKKGIRTILNFGHTFAHALEVSRQYRNLSHGEAVSLGMLYAAQLSCSLGLCKSTCVKELHNIIKLFELPDRISFDYLTIYKTMGYDKKFISGKIRLVLLRKFGQVVVVNGISSEKILKSLQVFAGV
jgi:3-dehydroquinate synthase